MSDNTILWPVKLFIDVLKDPDRKPIPRMISEILYLTFIFKRFPLHYFSSYLFKNWRINIGDFFPARFLYYKIKPFLNENEVREVLENKLYFYFFYKQIDIRTPEIPMYNFRKMFASSKKSIEINNTLDFKKLLQDLFKQNPSFDSLLIKKTYWSHGGEKIFKIYVDQIDKEPDIINELYFEVIKSDFLFQETIELHTELNVLNPSCLNTIRFDTIIDPDSKIEIISGYMRMRMSINNHCVDNTSSGGCYVGIDISTGRLKREAYLDLRHCGVKVLFAHPITRVVFENFAIPFFSQAKELAIWTASYTPGLRIVGWDVGIGETGPLLIEGNSDYDISGNDITYGGYLANPVFRKVLQELNYLQPVDVAWKQQL
jgi:hypothetical protein